MADKEDIHGKLEELLSTNPDISPSERVIWLQDLGNCLPKSYVPGLELKLYNVLKVYLHSKNYDLQKCALNLLHTSLRNLNLSTLPDALSLNLAYALISICNSGNDDTPEYQELWLKAFGTLQLMSVIFPILCKNHGTRLLSVFQKALNVPYTTTVQKLQALKMLDIYITSVDIQSVKEIIYHLCSEQLIPLVFSNCSENLHSLSLQIIYRFLPGIKEVLIKYPEEWEKIFADIRSKYVPEIERLIAENDCTFAKLWIFLIKLIGSKFHKGSPVVNSLLSCIEGAFKVPNLEVRKQSFMCWEVLIESFSIESNEALYTEKRIKLLTIPLKTNNGKTEELVQTKIAVWCKLLEVLIKNNLIGSFGVLESYLIFCFGPLHGLPLLYAKDSAHGLVSQGKKYPSVHLTTCKSLLQLIGNPKYIDEKLQSKLNAFKMKPPAVKTLDFIGLSKQIIDSVGESCLMLSQLEKDRAECIVVNEALWKSLLFTIDTLDNKTAKSKSIADLSAIILALINIARRKPNLINFGLKPLFNIITSNEFKFCQEEQFANDLFISMIGVVIKRDKILLHDDVITILKSVFTFKRNSERYLEFIANAKNLLLQENFVSPEKINALRLIWYIIEEELLIFDKNKVDEELYLKVFYEFLNWPIVTSNKARSTEKIDLKWRELYSFFCKTTSGLLQSKLSSMLTRSICDLAKETPNNVTNAEYAYYIISNLKLDNFDKETCEEISQIYSAIKTIVSMPSLPPEIVNIYESCVSHMLDTNSKFPKLHYVLPSINSCLTSLLDIYGKTDILRPAKLFLEQIDKNDEKLKPEIKSLTKLLDKHKNATDSKISSVEVDTKLEKSEKEQALILLGHDIKTMTPVKLKGSMLKIICEKQSPSTMTTEKSPKNKSDIKDTSSELVFVNSPYKFDPKKLTKQQKERLSRRRDDIPALYQDLTQSSSQLNDFNSSNSESLLEPLKPKFVQPQEQQPIETKECITADNNKTENNKEHGDNLKKESTESSHSEDIIQSDSEPMEQNTRLRQRKSLMSTSKTEPETSTVEKKKRGRKRKNSNDTVTGSPNGISANNMDGNKIRAESDDILKGTRRRRSVLIQESQLKNIEETIEHVIENESSSDTISSTPENSEQSTVEDAENLPIIYRAINKNKRKSKSVPPPLANVEAKKVKENENTETTKTDTNKLSSDDQDASMPDDNSLINLEANTELNKLANLPIYLGRPAKILRGSRRVSEGCIIKKPSSEKNIIDYANLFVLSNDSLNDDDKVKKKVIRELKNIQIDIKNSDEYLKTNGRKTRLSQGQQPEVQQRSRRGRPINKPSRSDENQWVEPSESDESDFIESSQENEKQVNIKECEVRALYSLEKITSGTLLQESDNRPKISPIKINIKSNKLIKTVSPKSKSETTEEKSKPENDKTPDITKPTEPNQEDQDQTLIMDKLDSQNVTLATETESLPSELVESDNPTEDICEKRRVIMSNSLISTEEDTPSTPPKLPNPSNLPTSPVSNDTPTRNKELLEDTIEISPIKKVPTKLNLDDDDDVPPVNTTDAENPPEENESPELFESETVNGASEKTDDTEKVSGNASQYTNRVMRKNKSRVLSGRSAKMMKMISAKQTFVPTTTAKASSASKTDTYCSPSSNRTKKMMNNLEKCDVIQDTEVVVTPSKQASTSNSEPLINQEDVLCIGKELPSPFALPTGSILKRKRNGPEETTEESIVPVIKKRRVNFSDPPVSCLKFIEKIIKPAAFFSKHLPKELRTTRSSIAEDQEIENEMNADQESQSLLDIVPLEDTEIPENPANIITTTKIYDNTKPICESLLDNEEPISKIIAKLTNSLDFVEPVTTVLENKNIDTIGDLAKLTELQVHTIPLKVELVKSILKEYYESLKQGTPTKEKRKITPVILSSPEKKITEPSTCGVSVIMENKDKISETPAANTTIVEERSEVIEVSNNECSENRFSSDTEKIEQPTINKVKSAVVASSPETLFSPPVNRMIIKAEFESPTNAKDNILNEKYCNIKVAKFIQHIRNLFAAKKFDPRPMIAALFANNTETLTQMNCWEDLVKYIVRDIGVWKLTKYLCSLKNIPALMIESILKNSLNEIGNDFICERLNKHEIIKFLSNECNLINLLQEYDGQTVFSTFLDLATDSQYSHLKYKEMLQELYACVPQIDICQMLYNLDVDAIGTTVVKRMSVPTDMDTFLETVCKSVPLEVYLKPTKTQTNADKSKETAPETNKNSSELANVVHSIDNNQYSKDEELMILRSIAKKWSALEFFQTFSQHTKQN